MAAEPQYKLVPVEPTPAMLAALVPDSTVEILRFRGYLFPHAVLDQMRADVAKGYRKIIAAAPAPSAPADQPSHDKQGQQDAHVGPPDWLRLARECGGSIYRHRAIPDEPSVAFGNESWARFTAALSAVAASPAPTEEPRTDGGEVDRG